MVVITKVASEMMIVIFFEEQLFKEILLAAFVKLLQKVLILFKKGVSSKTIIPNRPAL